MAERTAASPYARPIVADPEASLSHRPHHARRPRLWPLWCLCILLILVLSTLAAAGWWQSQQLEAGLARLQGELSNVHARLDGEQDGKQEQGDAVSRLAARFDRFESEQGRRGEDLEARLASVASGLEGLESRIETRFEEQDGSAARDESIVDARNSRLEAMQTSLDALEQTGAESREGLREELHEQQSTLDNLQQRQQEALSRLDERIKTVEDALDELMESAGPAHQADIETRLEDFETRLAASSTSDDATTQRLTELAGEIKEIRQSQLVINAKLEGIAP